MDEHSGLKKQDFGQVCGKVGRLIVTAAEARQFAAIVYFQSIFAIHDSGGSFVTEGFELPFSELTSHSRIRGCLLGGAVGDAIGAPVGFLSLKQILHRFGTDGIRDYAPLAELAVCYF